MESNFLSRRSLFLGRLLPFGSFGRLFSGLTVTRPFSASFGNLQLFNEGSPWRQVDLVGVALVGGQVDLAVAVGSAAGEVVGSGFALVDGGLVAGQEFLEPATLATDLAAFHKVVGRNEALKNKG